MGGISEDNGDNPRTENDSVVVGKNRQCIDKYMIPSKLAFCCIGGVFGANLPFLNIFLTSIGLTTKHAGLITGVSYACAAITGPIWGTLADCTGCRRMIFIVLCLGTMVTMVPVPWIANIVMVTELQDNCTQYNNTSVHKDTNVWLPGNISVHNDTNCVTESVLKNESELMVIMMVVMIVAVIFAVSLPTYVASLVVNVVTNREGVNFGQQRVWCSLSACIGTVAAGAAADHYLNGTMSQYTATFLVFLPYMVCMLPVGLILMKQTSFPQKKKKSKKVKKEVEDYDCEEGVGSPQQEQTVDQSQGTLGGQLLVLLKDVDTVVFLISVTFSGLAYEVIQNFILLLMEQTMGATKLLMTISMAVGGSSSVLLFPFSSQIIRRMGGPIPCIVVGIFSYFVRYMVMAYAVVPWQMISIQLLQGFGYALSWASIIEHTHTISPKQISTTMITIVGSIHNVASTCVANMVGGYLFHVYGGRRLMFCCSLVCGGWAVFMGLYFTLRHFAKKKSTSPVPTHIELTVKQSVELQDSDRMESSGTDLSMDGRNDSGDSLPTNETTEQTSDTGYDNGGMLKSPIDEHHSDIESLDEMHPDEVTDGRSEGGEVHPKTDDEQPISSVEQTEAKTFDEMGNVNGGFKVV